jgi:DNA-binding NarL/FixJ family response regulator
MNAAATALFADNGGVSVANGSLYFSDTAANDNLDNALKSLAAGTGEAVDMAARNFVARRPNKNRPLLVSVRSMAAQGAMAAYRQFTAIVLIRDPTVFVRLDTASLMRSYALSVAEAEIAEAFDIGLTLQEIAQQRSVAISTVRSQLYNLMAKLSVSSQTELARLLRQYRRAF